MAFFANSENCGNIEDETLHRLVSICKPRLSKSTVSAGRTVALWWQQMQVVEKVGSLMQYRSLLGTKSGRSNRFRDTLLHSDQPPAVRRSSPQLLLLLSCLVPHLGRIVRSRC
jgi:hypothetical protein